MIDTTTGINKPQPRVPGDFVESARRGTCPLPDLMFAVHFPVAAYPGTAFAIFDLDNTPVNLVAACHSWAEWFANQHGLDHDLTVPFQCLGE